MDLSSLSYSDAYAVLTADRGEIGAYPCSDTRARQMLSAAAGFAPGVAVSGTHVLTWRADTSRYALARDPAEAGRLLALLRRRDRDSRGNA